MMESSIVEYSAGHEGHRCGYCQSANTNYSHGMWAHLLSVEDYQDLIDRGWRRSGKYVYKPTLKQVCCPQYPIRCAVTDLHLTKSQKKTIKRVNRYLSFGHHPGTNSADELQEERGHEEVIGGGGQERRTTAVVGVGDAPAKTVDKTQCSESDVNDAQVAATTKLTKVVESAASAGNSSCQDAVSKSHTVLKPGVGQDPTKPAAKKAKLMRLERKQAKLLKSQGTSSVTTAESPKQAGVKKEKGTERKTLEDYLNDVIDKPAHTLEIKLVRSSTATAASYAIYKRYQMAIHGDEESECLQSSYKSFLVDSPLLQPTHLEENNLPEGHGSFHQHYILDGKIIAVGVIDILPRCVSSVYFYYDPDFAFLSLGTYSALRELAFTRYLNEIQPEITHYYLGFYIHSCPKMRYKGQYVPSFLCCPETYKWFPIEQCRQQLDTNKYSRFAPANAHDEDQLKDIDEVLCLYQRQPISYGSYRKMKSKSKADIDRDEVSQYASFIGASCARRMLLFREK